MSEHPQQIVKGTVNIVTLHPSSPILLWRWVQWAQKGFAGARWSRPSHKCDPQQTHLIKAHTRLITRRTISYCPYTPANPTFKFLVWAKTTTQICIDGTRIRGGVVEWGFIGSTSMGIDWPLVTIDGHGMPSMIIDVHAWPCMATGVFSSTAGHTLALRIARENTLVLLPGGSMIRTTPWELTIGPSGQPWFLLWLLQDPGLSLWRLDPVPDKILRFGPPRLDPKRTKIGTQLPNARSHGRTESQGAGPPAGIIFCSSFV
ncbi:hypothetical protein B0H17DRAFT_1149259 [Mycena rosella]|uniref:Uncharacterized protein n=1 Tax=Mycena rosella TaxID=1033263 RepID=A0AAD7FQW7_MYCRO|nr:hypothetical protein B0H17DRAFT_1149259 [Mycena rosella]